VLQRLIDDRAFDKTQTFELQSLGVVFGDVLATELRLHWELVTDEYGNDPVLRYGTAQIQVAALTMISKRVEDGREIDLTDLVEGVRKALKLIKVLKARFEKNMKRHKGLEWARVQAKLEANADKLWSLNEMEKTGGEPDVVGQDQKTGEFIFFDCSPETPKGRTSVCYDREGLESRKEHRPKNTAMDMSRCATRGSGWPFVAGTRTGMTTSFCVSLTRARRS
jgi:hypothetical protein